MNGTVEFYKLAAQVIPVLWLSAIVEARTFDEVLKSKADAGERVPRPLSASALVLLVVSAASETMALIGVVQNDDRWWVSVAVATGLAIGGLLVLAPATALWVGAYVNPAAASLRRALVQFFSG